MGSLRKLNTLFLGLALFATVVRFSPSILLVHRHPFEYTQLASQLNKNLIALDGSLTTVENRSNRSSEVQEGQFSATPNRDEITSETLVNTEVKVRWVFLLHVSGNKNRFDTIRKTWFRNHTNDIGLLVFGNGLTSEATFFTSAAKGSAFETTQHAFGHALQLFEFAQYFAKFDDDTYVYHREMIRQIENSTGNNYWGYPIRYGSFVFGSGGAGYILSRVAAEKLQLCKPSFVIYEDAAVGECMKRDGFPLVDLIGLHPHHPYQMIRWDKHGHPGDRIRPEPVEGYMNPLSYHYIQPEEMLRMHDDIHLHGFPMKRSSALPRVIHRFREEPSEQPDTLKECKGLHNNWTHMVWDKSLIKSRFPSAENNAGVLQYDGAGGALLNQDLLDAAREPIRQSDVAGLEALMIYGGVYAGAGEDCPPAAVADGLLADALGSSQGFSSREADGARAVVGAHPLSPLSIVLVSELRNADGGPSGGGAAEHVARVVGMFGRPGLPPYLRVRAVRPSPPRPQT